MPYLLLFILAFLAAILAGYLLNSRKAKINCFLGAAILYSLVALIYPIDTLNLPTYIIVLFLGLFYLPFSIGQRVQQASSWAKKRFTKTDGAGPSGTQE